MSWVSLGGAAIGAAGSYLASRNQPQTVTQSQTSGGYNNPQANPATLPLYGMLAGNAQQMGQTPTPFFPGQTYVGPSSATQYGVNLGMSGMPYYQQGASMLGQASPYQAEAAKTALGNYNFLSGAADVANNPYVQGQLAANKQQVTQALNEQWLPQINQGAQSVNALGSSRQGLAQAQGIERAAQQLSNQNASTMLNAYGQGLNAQQSALNSLGGLQQGMMQPGLTQAAAGNMLNQGGQNALGWGQVTEGYQQSALNDAMARFQHQYQEPWQRMGNVQGVLGSFNPLISSNNFSSAQSTSPNPNYQNPWMSAIGGGLAGAGAGQNFAQAWANRGNQAPISSNNGGTQVSPATSTGGAPVYNGGYQLM